MRSDISLEGVAAGTAPWLFASISWVGDAMSDGKGDIQLDENRRGLVYRMRLDEHLNVSRMEPLVAGGPYNASSAMERALARPEVSRR